MARVKKDEAGAFTEEATTLVDDFIDAAMAPVGLLSSKEDTFYSARTLGFASVGYAAAGIAIGARNPTIPLLGV